VIRLSVSEPGKLSFNARLNRPGNHQTGGVGVDGLLLGGMALLVNDNPKLPVKEHQTGIRFRAHLHATSEGGQVTTTPTSTEAPAQLRVSGATAVTPLLDCATDFRYPSGVGAMRSAVERNLTAASHKSYEQLRDRHIADYQPIFRRASLELNPPRLPRLSRSSPSTQPSRSSRLTSAFNASRLARMITV
jgi:alpha-L-fucosidase 2